MTAMAAMMPARTISTPKLTENAESSLVRAETSSQTMVSISGVRISAWARSAAVEMTASGSVMVIPPRSVTPADLSRRSSGFTEARTTSHETRSPGGWVAAPWSAVMWVTPGSSASSWSTVAVSSGGVMMRRWSMTADHYPTGAAMSRPIRRSARAAGPSRAARLR
jgi:hypothetical protein